MENLLESLQSFKHGVTYKASVEGDAFKFIFLGLEKIDEDKSSDAHNVIVFIEPDVESEFLAKLLKLDILDEKFFDNFWDMVEDSPDEHYYEDLVCWDLLNASRLETVQGFEVVLIPELFKCGACSSEIPKSEFIGGVCPACDKMGVWIDPAGGVHQGDEGEFVDNAAMYE